MKSILQDLVTSKLINRKLTYGFSDLKFFRPKGITAINISIKFRIFDSYISSDIQVRLGGIYGQAGGANGAS